MYKFNNNPNSIIILTLQIKINSTIIFNHKIQIMDSKLHRPKVHSIHLDNFKVIIIISCRMAKIQILININKIPLIIKINFKINKFNQIINKKCNLVNLINQIIVIIKLEIFNQIHKMVLIINLIMAPISIQISEIQIIAIILVIKISILHKIKILKVN